MSKQVYVERGTNWSNFFWIHYNLCCTEGIVRVIAADVCQPLDYGPHWCLTITSGSAITTPDCRLLTVFPYCWINRKKTLELGLVHKIYNVLHLNKPSNLTKHVCFNRFSDTIGKFYLFLLKIMVIKICCRHHVCTNHLWLTYLALNKFKCNTV